MSGPINSSQPWLLTGKIALITGGSRGIGRAIAEHLAQKGLQKLAITYVSNKAAADLTLEQCRSFGVKQAIAIQADVLDTTMGPRVIKEVLDGLGTTTIDILVNNAILTDSSKVLPIADTTVDNFDENMRGNVFTPIGLMIAFMEHVPKHGGRVINISSMASKMGNRDPIMTYGASKAALDSYTRSFAESFAAERGMTFNSVSVGPTATQSLKSAMEYMPPGYIDKAIADVTAAPRVGEPEDIAYIVGFLASEEGRWVNGAAVSANGGQRQLLAALG
ncbi:hypothetical protein Daus18300_013466 [Diaporthe australafricana]|uniref:Uncharacterized protein n=1 Tax=Diaporthe australafricana TaxID=127596 RepID=A0ABR3VYT0_9PEZI